MTDHRRWLELAAAGPAFAPADRDADGLAEHLASCAACSQRVAAMRGDLAAVGAIRDVGAHEDLRERIRRAATAEPAGLNPILVIAILGLLLAAIAGATLTVGSALLRDQGELSAPAALPELLGKRLVWETPVVHLGADRLDLRANGRTVHAETNAIRVDGDPGDLASWTLELTWFEAGLEQRLNLYFRSDGASWWIDELRAYDSSAPKAEWAVFPRERLAVTPVGGVFRGDIVAQGKGRVGQVDLALRGVVLGVTPQASFTEPLGGGVQLASDPFGPGGPLRCSGILQLPPPIAEQELQARGYRLSWRYETAVGKDSGRADLSLRAPQVGWITSTAVGENGELIVFVADPTRPFGGPPAVLPPDCTGTSPG